MRRADDVERRRLNESFAALCAIPSPSYGEGAVARHVAAELRDLGFEVQEDGAGAALPGQSGNLLCRIAGPGEPVLLCAHLDTVQPHGPIDPQVRDGSWVDARGGILGADNKAAVAALLAVARRARAQGLPRAVELLFTVAEEDALAGSRMIEEGWLHSAIGWVLDQASPIGDVVMASPTSFRLEATFQGQAAHAGLRPQDGRSAVLAAARAVAAMPHGRLDEDTTANVGAIHGGTASNVVPDRCTVLAEARSQDPERAEAVVTEMVDRCYDAANEPECACDVDLVVHRMFEGYRQRLADPEIAIAHAALEACGHTPRPVSSGGGTDANALRGIGVACANLANGTERNHEPGESVAVAALEQSLDVVLALVHEAAP